MERTQFEFILKDLEQMFEDLSDWQREQYFDQLGRTPEDILKKAIKRLIGEHKYSRTPLIGEVKDAVRDIIDESNQAPADPPEGCDKCNQIGVLIYPVLSFGHEYPTAFPCECAKGIIYKKAWDGHKKRGRFKKLEKMGEKQ